MNEAFKLQVVFDGVNLCDKQTVADNGCGGGTAPDRCLGLLYNIIDDQKIWCKAFFGNECQLKFNPVCYGLGQLPAVAFQGASINQIAENVVGAMSVFQ